MNKAISYAIIGLAGILSGYIYSSITYNGPDIIEIDSKGIHTYSKEEYEAMQKNAK